MSEPASLARSMAVEPSPTDDETAAIAAAVHLELFRSAPAPEPSHDGRSAEARWRFSGRWWN